MDERTDRWTDVRVGAFIGSPCEQKWTITGQNESTSPQKYHCPEGLERNMHIVHEGAAGGAVHFSPENI